MKNKVKHIFFILILSISLFVLIALSHIVFTPFLNKTLFENHISNIASENISETFKIDKIVLFSSCSSDTTINSNNTTTINNLTQFTDIAIFINSTNNDDYSLENTFKSVSIKDFSFNTRPSLGTPNLYYKGLTDFAKPGFLDENIINSDLSFTVSSKNEIDYSKPTLFNNCANPITLSYVNSNIKNNYTITNDNNSITYDGSLLKKCNIILDDINSSLSFTICIENNLGEHFKCPVYINIPLKNNDNSIYDGSYTLKYNPNYEFYKYEK